MSDTTPPPTPPASVPPPGPPPRRSFGRVRGCLAIVGLLMLALSIFINLLLFLALMIEADPSSMQANRPYQEEYVQGDQHTAEKVLIIDLSGIITNFSDSELSPSMVETFRRQMEQGLDDHDVKAILVRINSPGGEIMASDMLYHEIKKAADQKPLVVFMESMAASGGFYAAMGSEFIMANELTLTGSIGVIVQPIPYDQLGEKIGVKFNTFTSGPNKAMFGGAKPITPEQASIIEGIIEAGYTRFLDIVGKSRDLEPDFLKQKLADGRVLTGQQAKDAGLVDELGYLEDAIAKARDMGKAKKAKVVRYRAEINIFELFGFGGKAGVPDKIEVNLVPDLPRLQPGLPYYLAPHILLDR